VDVELFDRGTQKAADLHQSTFELRFGIGVATENIDSIQH
jgi:hypothetical protein